MITPAIAALLGLGGYVAYDKLKDGKADASQPASDKKMPFYSDWFNSGSQVQTGNGSPKTDAGAIAVAVSDVSKFATSLVSYFGTSKSQGNDFGGGISTGGPTESYGNGYGGFDNAQGWSEPPVGVWSNPADLHFDGEK